MNADIKTVAAYIRVSTENQTELSPDSQLKEIRKFADQNGYILPDEYIFRDCGISGRRADKRPEFIRMIAAAKQKPSPFSAVLLWKFSRFARNQEESVFYKGMLSKNSVEVISISEPMLDGPFGSLIERIIEWFDEFYSINLSTEVKRGMIEKVSRGGVVSCPPFGYKTVGNEYVIEPDTACIVRQIYNDYLNGTEASEIARRLNDMGIRTRRGNLWEKRTVEYILRNPVYIGKIRWNPGGTTGRSFDDPDVMISDGHHKPIIDNETFDKVKNLYESKRRNNPRYTHKTGIKCMYMLHGLVKCSSCGSSMSMSARGQGLQCTGYVKGRCKVSHYISLNKLNESVIKTLEYAFGAYNFHISIKNNPTEDNIADIDIKALIEKEQKKYVRIKRAYEDGVYTFEELRESQRRISNNINSLKSGKINPESMQKVPLKNNIDKRINLSEALRDNTISEQMKNVLLKSFISKIVFDRQSGTINLFFYI